MRGKLFERGERASRGVRASMRPALYARETEMKMSVELLYEMASMRPALYARETGRVRLLRPRPGAASMRPALYARETEVVVPCVWTGSQLQ